MLTTLPIPPEMAAVMSDARASAPKGSDAEKYALRQAQLAGFYIQGGKWSRLAPNVRNKVQVRHAEKQPDGKYIVPNVPVFYPNAVKSRVVFSADDIRKCVANTNAAIENGGQKPALTLGHPSPGERAPSYGAAVNFREMDGKPGWVSCDLVDVDANFAAEWMRGRCQGLSPGFVQDAGGLNRRFGHVARLGAQSQALAHLPVTEIYSAADQFVFSADASDFAARPSQGTPMKKSECYAALGAAHASLEAGEPGADTKVKEAEANLAAFSANEPEDSTVAPAGEESKPADTAKDKDKSTEFAADPVAAFAALEAEVKALKASNTELVTERDSLKRTERQRDHEAAVRKLAETHEFSADEVLADFAADGWDDGKIGTAMKMLARMPARVKSAADAGRMVPPEEAAPPAPTKKAPADDGLSFSAEDVVDIRSKLASRGVAAGSVASPNHWDGFNL